MSIIRIKRWYHNDCTIGRLRVNDFQCFTLELPDLDNQTDVSCIYEGEFDYEKFLSPRHKEVILLKNVEDRSMIEVHSGNFTRQILGCLLVGNGIKWLDRDSIPDVTNSKNTLKALLNELDDTGTIQIRS